VCFFVFWGRTRSVAGGDFFCFVTLAISVLVFFLAQVFWGCVLLVGVRLLVCVHHSAFASGQAMAAVFFFVFFVCGHLAMGVVHSVL